MRVAMSDADVIEKQLDHAPTAPAGPVPEPWKRTVGIAPSARRNAPAPGTWFVRRRRVTAPALALLASGALATVAAQQRSAPRNVDPSVNYVGSQVCAGCHRQLYDSYKTTAMGNSMAPVDDALLPLVATQCP